MAATTGKAQCILCGKERSAVRCEGCLQFYCYTHLADHRQELNKQFDEIEVNRDQFRDTLTQQITNLEKHTSIQQIDQWKDDSIKKIEQIAEECKRLLLQHTTELITQLEVNLNKLTEELRHVRQEDDFNEIDLKQFNERLRQLAKELDQSPNISIQQDSASPINKISVVVESFSKCARSEPIETDGEKGFFCFD
jgi:DNA repair exonuclease SbcCD ATPase subunit